MFRDNEKIKKTIDMIGKVRYSVRVKHTKPVGNIGKGESAMKKQENKRKYITKDDRMCGCFCCGK